MTIVCTLCGALKPSLCKCMGQFTTAMGLGAHMQEMYRKYQKGLRDGHSMLSGVGVQENVTPKRCPYTGVML